MKYLAYARGKNDMELKEQITAIKEFCNTKEIELYKEKVYSEQDRGKAYGTPVFNLVKELLEDEDVLIVSSMSIIGVSKQQLLEEMKWVETRKTRFISLDIPFTLTSYDNKMLSEMTNKLVVETLDCIITADQKRREAYQKENEKLKAATGVGLAGRPRTLSREKFNATYERVLKGEITPFEAIYKLGIPQGTYYRYKRDYDREHELD